MKISPVIILLLLSKSVFGLVTIDKLKVTSPNGKLSLHLSLKENTFYSVEYKGESIISSSLIGLSLPDPGFEASMGFMTLTCRSALRVYNSGIKILD